MLTPISETSVELLQGERWVLQGRLTDDDGYGVDASISVAIILDGVTEAGTAEELGDGFFRVVVAVDDPGTYLVTVSAAGYGLTVYRADVQDLSNPLANLPDLADVKAYLKETKDTKDAEIQDALDAETQAQKDVCRIPAIYPLTLRQALLRRVARNLAARGIPLAVYSPAGSQESTVPPGRDFEVRRLEARFRKLVQP